jgi:hypothetical protein
MCSLVEKHYGPSTLPPLLMLDPRRVLLHLDGLIEIKRHHLGPRKKVRVSQPRYRFA